MRFLANGEKVRFKTGYGSYEKLHTGIVTGRLRSFVFMYNVKVTEGMWFWKRVINYCVSPNRITDIL